MVVLRRRGGGVSLPYSVDFSQSATLPTGWVGSAAAIVAGKLSITPNKGGDLITNGNFAAWTGDNPNNWTVLVTEDATNYVTQNPAGECQIISDNAKAIGIRQTVMSLGKWYEVDLDCTARSAGSLVVTDGASINIIEAINAVGNYVGTGLCTYATDGRMLIKRVGVTNATSDNVIAKLLTDADLITYYDQALPNVGSVKAAWTIASGNKRSGVVGWWNKSAPLANCLVAYHNGIANIILVKYVGTTPAIVLSNTATNYVAGASVEIRKTAATTFQLWYNGAQVGIDQTISDAAIIDNQYFGVFGTHPDGACASFYVNP